MSVAKNVKFGKIDATTVATISVLGKLVNSGTILGDVTVGASDNTSATITNNEDAILTAGNAISGANVTMTSIDNYGKILNEGKLYATKVDNKVVGVSVFQGNITAVTATVTEAGF
ncbi:hypothetical protein DW932_25150 [Bacteroides intestinalis]|uniref:hypothetical protein n=1 Tax=Bacteroides intestinalis TaxID=329854 RepID=UPI000E48A747|nr:hypothetical protein [Bacteroides intestinalis]RHA51919.1 hypothetical protein DW932_25150 [Bacteroides intestinalis]